MSREVRARKRHVQMPKMPCPDAEGEGVRAKWCYAVHEVCAQARKAHFFFLLPPVPILPSLPVLSQHCFRQHVSSHAAPLYTMPCLPHASLCKILYVLPMLFRCWPMPCRHEYVLEGSSAAKVCFARPAHVQQHTRHAKSVCRCVCWR